MNESNQPPEQDQPSAAGAEPPTPTRPPTPPPTPPQGEPETHAQPAPVKPRLRDRVLGMRAVAGVALATLVLGGLGGAAIGAAAGDDSPGERQGDHGFGGRFEGRPDGRPAPGQGSGRGADQGPDRDLDQQDQLPAPSTPQSSS